MLERFIAHASQTDSDAILSFLTTRQHLHPHATVRAVLDQTIDHFGCCPVAVERAIEWLMVTPTSPIGRLRRSELVQLAKSVHRFWSQAESETSLAR